MTQNDDETNRISDNKSRGPDLYQPQMCHLIVITQIFAYANETLSANRHFIVILNSNVCFFKQ